tara:strand:+ start:331 stop:609 length:279 start_codon:yes stop_codon:yes gene_type:complete
MEIKGFLFFLGSLMRWPVENTKSFLSFHLYIICLYVITFMFRSWSINAANFIFTLGVLFPLMRAIYRGLPLDCLNYKSAVEKEFMKREIPAI